MSQVTQEHSHAQPAPADGPFGLRLRRAREAAGLSVADVAGKLKLKIATVEALEKEDLDALGAPVYVRGYFSSYARLVGVPTVLLDNVFATRHPALPQLQTTARISHSRYLFDRYAKRVVYAVLTASVVLPVVLLATRDQLPQPGATLTPLDTSTTFEQIAPPAAVANSSDSDTGNSTERPTPTARLPRSAGESPVVASLGPFYSAASEPEPAVPAPAQDVQGLSLHLSGDSWVEVLDHSGRRIEHGVLRAGDSRRFQPGKVARVSIGNADAVEVRMNGAETDIAPYRRANVARFTVSSDGMLAPAGG
jgi:cytoskeleton protein RodZ